MVTSFDSFQYQASVTSVTLQDGQEVSLEMRPVSQQDVYELSECDTDQKVYAHVRKTLANALVDPRWLTVLCTEDLFRVWEAAARPSPKG